MPVDPQMLEIAEIFMEETAEGLDVMESGLLNLNYGDADPETMNAIFRAAHSIKGGSGMIGLTEISEFAHHVETLLDELRQGKRQVQEAPVQVLLQSVDCIRGMVEMIGEEVEIDTSRAEELEKQLSEILNSDGHEAFATEFSEPGASAEQFSYHISIEPSDDFFDNGDEFIDLLQQLKVVGEYAVTLNGLRNLDFDNVIPLSNELSWDVYLTTKITLSELQSWFDKTKAFVQINCELIESGAGDQDIINSVAKTEEPPAVQNKQSEAEILVEVNNQSDTSRDPVSSVAKVSGDKNNEPADKNGEQSKKQTAPKSTPKKTVKKVQRKSEGGSIRVSIPKIDALINLVGELVITQSMLSRFNGELRGAFADDLREGLIQLERNTRDLQESVMQIRMLPISFAFSRFPRLVHDTCKQLGKKVELVLSGEQTELDKTVLEKIGDPLVHLVRNSLDHGVETPDVRLAAGKPATGTVELNAYHEGGNIVIEIIDDGAGINEEKVLQKARKVGLVGTDEEIPRDKIHNLIFMAGFSTADKVSDLSGRGVGMDVVRRNITDLGGNVSVKSEMGKGSKFTIQLPLTLAILDGQLVKVGGQIFIISLISMLETTQISAAKINSVADEIELYRLRDEYIPIIRLYEVFNIESERDRLLEGLLVIVEADGHRVGLLVDDVLEQQQVVIKSLESNFRQIVGISGATILGDGTVALIIDVPGLIQLFMEKQKEHSYTLADYELV